MIDEGGVMEMKSHMNHHEGTSVGENTNLEVSVEVHVEQQVIAMESMGRDRVATSPKSLGVRYFKPG
jgi:hypothetical protein